MTRILFLSTLLTLFTFTRCKVEKTNQQIIDEAVKHQSEALVIGASVDTMLEARFMQGAVLQDIDRLRKFRNAADTWRHKMVLIPGASDHADHEGHEHHAHSHEAEASSHSALDLLKLQQEWKAEIEAIRDSIK